jgi:hypothetical protein
VIRAALSSALRDRPCRMRSSDVRVRSPATGLTTCADVTVVCDPLEVDADDPHRVLDPRLNRGAVDPSDRSNVTQPILGRRRRPAFRRGI